MPRRSRVVASGGIYHVLNRAAKRIALFRTRSDYAAFEQLLIELTGATEMRLLSYCIMPNHWHLVLSPRTAAELSNFMRRLTVTHALRWHAFHRSGGTGPVYQGRYKSIPVQDDAHFIQLCKYVERNPLRAALVGRAQDWEWSSLWRRCQNSNTGVLTEWPVQRPADWNVIVNDDEPRRCLDEVRRAIKRGAPYGDDSWVADTARALGLGSTLRARGRPRKDSRPLFT
jgi:putative transposase